MPLLLILILRFLFDLVVEAFVFKHGLVVLHVLLGASLFHRVLNILSDLSRTQVSCDAFVETNPTLGCLIIIVFLFPRVVIFLFFLLGTVNRHRSLVLELGLVLVGLFHLGLKAFPLLIFFESLNGNVRLNVSLSDRVSHHFLDDFRLSFLQLLDVALGGLRVTLAASFIQSAPKVARVGALGGESGP